MTFFGITRADGCLWCNVASCLCGAAPTPVPVIEDGRRVFEVGSDGGFLLVVEARPGTGGGTVGTFVPQIIPGQTQRPDLQILANRPLGNGSTRVCDTLANPPAGGVPGLPELQFGSEQHVTDALLDLACRFQPRAPAEPCTLNRNGLPAVITEGGLPSTGRQFCLVVTPVVGFPLGDTVLAVQVRSTGGSLGPRQEIVVRRTQ